MSFPHQQPHDPKPQQQLHDRKQEPFCSVRVALLPSVRRHGRRCVQNCGFFSCLQRRACAIEQTHFGSTAQKQSCQASQGVECSQDFLVSQALDVASRAAMLLLCDVSSLESVALLPRLQRCFQRVDAFLKEHAEALQKISARNLDTALRSRHMLQFPMSTFTRLFLGKFEKQLETEQVRALSTWQEHLCVPSAAEQEAAIAKRKKAVLDIQDFLVNFAPEILQLQKKNLRGVVYCNQSNKHKEWQRARNYFVRQYDSFTFEEKELLEDWELLLCDVSSLESVALLPRLQRCFQRVDSFLREHAKP